MPKGKKFDAAEKHFREKEIRLNRQLRAAEDARRAAEKHDAETTAENQKLEAENEKLRAENVRLAELMELTPEQRKDLFERIDAEKKLAQTMSAIGHMGRTFLGPYGL